MSNVLIDDLFVSNEVESLNRSEQILTIGGNDESAPAIVLVKCNEQRYCEEIVIITQDEIDDV